MICFLDLPLYDPNKSKSSDVRPAEQRSKLSTSKYADVSRIHTQGYLTSNNM